MKLKNILALLLIGFPLLIQAQSGFKVKFNIPGLGEKKLKVSWIRNGKTVVDTLHSTSKDLVIWEGKLEDPQLVRMEVIDTSLYLRIGKAIANPPALMFLLTNSQIEIKADPREVLAAVLKSKDREVMIYEKLRKEDLPDARQSWSIQKEISRKTNSGDTSGNGLLKDKANALRKKNQALRIKFVDEHPNAGACLPILNSLFLILSVDDMSIKFNSLAKHLQGSKSGQTLLAKIESNRRTALGKPMIAFSQTGHDGNIVDLTALKGKVILVDFWGSWCVPCRRSHPDLRKMYDTFHARGLEIVGVSNENVSGNRSRQEQELVWKKAIREDSINWLHVLYEPEINDLIKSYDINGYPTKFLIDQKGNFVMRILGNSPGQHELLAKKLEELLPEIK